jgi:glycosyltransferase involved in cell wall biosynthesis
MEDFKVSVIIPVYNAASYVVQACHSALEQEDVAEVILVEDGSADDSFEVCKQLAGQHSRVRFFTHENNINKGASESRNLGIRMAQYPFVAFLDADDYYLPNRFKTTKKIFDEIPEADGVYECTKLIPQGKLYTISRSIPPKRLLHYLLRGTYGHFTTNAITLKKSCFDKVGYFNSELTLHQDTEMWFRLAHLCNLQPGNLKEPVAAYRKYPGNRIIGHSPASYIKAYRAFRLWLKGKKQLGFINSILLSRKIAKLLAKEKGGYWVSLFIKEIVYS